MGQSPQDMLHAYVRAFETLRPSEVIPFYALPCTFIRADGVWVVQDEATTLALVGHLQDHAKMQGYSRTVISGLATRELGSGLAELCGLFTRLDASGSLIVRFGFTYIVRLTSDGWKIVVAVAHDAVAEVPQSGSDGPAEDGC
jgi:hypothetical protein